MQPSIDRRAIKPGSSPSDHHHSRSLGGSLPFQNQPLTSAQTAVHVP